MTDKKPKTDFEYFPPITYRVLMTEYIQSKLTEGSNAKGSAISADHLTVVA